MKSSLLYPVFIIALACLSCNKHAKEEQKFDTLMQEVIDVHDEVMPKMGEISTLIKYLDPKIDTTATGKSYQKAQQDLKDSYDFMMKWMSDFSDTFPHEGEDDTMTSKKFASQMKLLREEEVKVNKLRDQINSSIENAKKLLKKS